MKQKCSNTFSLVALVNVILVTTVLYRESTIIIIMIEKNTTM